MKDQTLIRKWIDSEEPTLHLTQLSPAITAQLTSLFGNHLRRVNICYCDTSPMETVEQVTELLNDGRWSAKLIALCLIIHPQISRNQHAQLINKLIAGINQLESLKQLKLKYNNKSPLMTFSGAPCASPSNTNWVAASVPDRRTALSMRTGDRAHFACIGNLKSFFGQISEIQLPK